MDVKANTILITGGSNGIGLALAERFLQSGNEVIVCGRREEKLKEAKERLPKLHTRCCDVADEAQRIALYDWVVKEFPTINVLVNNAGIQQRINLTEQTVGWQNYKREIAINLEAPIHFSMLFMPHLIRQSKPVIINVSSGLSFMPPVWVPVYGATKAGLHSFTFSLRVQLADTNIKVVEVIPPAVNTDLGGAGMHTFGAPLDKFADEIFAGFENGDLEIGFANNLEATYLPRKDIERNALQAWQRMKR